MPTQKPLCALSKNARIKCHAPAIESGLCVEHDKTHYVAHDAGDCAVEGCDKKADVGGQCKAHYMREWRINNARATLEHQTEKKLARIDKTLKGAMAAKSKERVLDAKAKAEEKLERMRSRLTLKVAERGDAPREFEAVTIRVSKKAKAVVLKRFPSLYRGACDIVEGWANSADAQA
jgi:hypothetical protein